jgi:hypothetical protein
MLAWRKLLPDNIVIYNSRYGCLAKTTCTGNSGIYKCPMKIDFKKNGIVPGYCSGTADLARLGQDMKPAWQNIVTGILSRIGRGAVSRPGFWSDPDYLVPHANLLTYNEIRTQFSAWCITSSPLIISSDLRTLATETIQIFKNPDAIRVNQQYYTEGGDMWTMSGVLWTFKKRLSETETALLVIHVGANFAKTGGPKTDLPATFKIETLKPFGNSTTTLCQMKNIWTQKHSTLLPNTEFTVAARDCVFILIDACK